MREIKFRAWDSKNNVWMTLSELSQKLGDWFVYNPEVPDVIGVKLMQYTGLKDKNGKEVYEGDIVKTGNLLDEGENSTETGTVIWDDPMVSFALIGKRGSQKVYLDFYQTRILEVIGNIYENPQLIK